MCPRKRSSQRREGRMTLYPAPPEVIAQPWDDVLGKLKMAVEP